MILGDPDNRQKPSAAPQPLLGLDVGDKRVGIALGWRSPSFARPAGMFLRSQGQAEDEILKLIEIRGISEVVVGLPLSDDGSENEQCERVRNFCRRLERRTSAKLHFIDEYGTSQESLDRLALGGRSERAVRREGRIDSASAALILQTFLDQQAAGDSAGDRSENGDSREVVQASEEEVL